MHRFEPPPPPKHTHTWHHNHRTIFARFFFFVLQTVMTLHNKTAKSNQPPVDIELGYFLQAALQSAYLCLLQRGWFYKLHNPNTQTHMDYTLSHLSYLFSSASTSMFSKSTNKAYNILSWSLKTFIADIFLNYLVVSYSFESIVTKML